MKTKQILTGVLVTLAWFWTAYECTTVGVDVIDMILLKSATNGAFVWLLAGVLTYLTIIWMPKNLLTRAVMGLLMLMPSEVFPLLRPHLPDHGFAAIQLFVGLIYILLVIGMYGMFYPWRIESALKWISSKFS